MEIFGIPISAFLGQLLLGLVNGSFYAMLSLGLAVIFGLLNVINFCAWCSLHDGCFYCVDGLTIFWCELLGYVIRCAIISRCVWHHHRKNYVAMVV